VICTKCFRALRSEAFYKSPAKVCKECHKAQMRVHYQEPGFKTKNAERQRARLKDKGNYAKHDARMAVRQALERGEMVRESNCALCNSAEDIEAHHRDYSKKLEVIWLCRNCHAMHHAAEVIKQRQVKDKAMSISGSADDITHSIYYAIM